MSELKLRPPERQEESTVGSRLREAYIGTGVSSHRNISAGEKERAKTKADPSRHPRNARMGFGMTTGRGTAWEE